MAGKRSLPDELPAGVGAFRFSEGECRLRLDEPLLSSV